MANNTDSVSGRTLLDKCLYMANLPGYRPRFLEDIIAYPDDMVPKTTADKVEERYQRMVDQQQKTNKKKSKKKGKEEKSTRMTGNDVLWMCERMKEHDTCLQQYFPKYIERILRNPNLPISENNVRMVEKRYNQCFPLTRRDSDDSGYVVDNDLGDGGENDSQADYDDGSYRPLPPQVDDDDGYDAPLRPQADYDDGSYRPLRPQADYDDGYDALFPDSPLLPQAYDNGGYDSQGVDFDQPLRGYGLPYPSDSYGSPYVDDLNNGSMDHARADRSVGSKTLRYEGDFVPPGSNRPDDVVKEVYERARKAADDALANSRLNDRRARKAMHGVPKNRG